MPNIWTHICFCENVVDAISKPDVFMKQESMMKLGAQGLQLIQFDKLMASLHNNSAYNNQHVTDMAPSNVFLTDLVESAKDKSKDIQAYVFGFMTNYILEQQILSYVQAWGGKNREERQKLKINIDTVLMKRYHNLETWKVPVRKEIDVGLLLNKEVTHLLYQNLTKHFQCLNLTSQKYIQVCYLKLKWKLLLINDPYGWKKFLFNKWITPYSSQPVKDNIDYLNLQKRPWEDAREHVIRTESFEELYEQARLKAIDILTEVTSYWQDSSKPMKSKVSQSLEYNLRNNQSQLKYP